MQVSTGAYITLMSEFTVGFSSRYIDYVNRDSAKQETKKEFNQIEMTDEVLHRSFETYLDYMSRKTALISKSKLSIDEQYSLDKVEDKIQELLPVEKKIIEMHQSKNLNDVKNLETGMFDFTSVDLKKEDVNAYKKQFSTARQNNSVLFQDVVSFETQALIEAGIYDPISNELKREPLIMASRKMINSMYQTEGLNDSTITVGEIHYNTNNFHIHFSTTEVNPTRKKIWVKNKQKFETKGVREEYTLEKMRSVFANTIFDRTSELEKLNELRNDLRMDVKEELKKPTEKDILLLIKLKDNLPSDSKKWFSKNLSEENKETMNELIDSLLEKNSNFEEFKRIAKEEDIVKSNTFGTIANGKQTFYEGRMHGQNGIYYRLGNSILQELKKEYSVNKKNELNQSVQKIVLNNSGLKNNYDSKISRHEQNRNLKQNIRADTTIKRSYRKKSDKINRLPPQSKEFNLAENKIYHRRSLESQIKHLRYVASNDFEKHQQEMAFEKLQRDIEFSKNDTRLIE